MQSLPSSRTDSLPIIDVSALREGAPHEAARTGRALRQACLHTGFFYIKGHGIEQDLIERVFNASKAFFSQPEEIKRRVDKSCSPVNRGYEPMRGQTLEPGTPPDLKEGFYIGEEVPAGDPRVLAGAFNTGPNQWPAEVPDFRAASMNYFKVMLDLSSCIMRGLALSLELPPAYFRDFCTDPLATLRLLHYPPQPATPLPGEKGCGAHTDFGGITILLLDDKPGLQVWNAASGRWIDAEPIPGTFIVNLGDMIARWTNDQYRSTLHRVINVSGEERYSIPFFFSGALEHEVRCLPSCLAENEAPRYPPVTVEEHLREMYRRTYA